MLYLIKDASKQIIKKIIMVRQRYQPIPSRDIDDQRILGSDWPKGKPGHTQPRLVILNVTFPW